MFHFALLQHFGLHRTSQHSQHRAGHATAGRGRPGGAGGALWWEIRSLDDRLAYKNVVLQTPPAPIAVPVASAQAQA
jgi:hypothetical protein